MIVSLEGNVRQIIWIAAHSRCGTPIKRTVLWLLLWPLLISVQLAGLHKSESEHLAGFHRKRGYEDR